MPNLTNLTQGLGQGVPTSKGELTFHLVSCPENCMKMKKNRSGRGQVPRAPARMWRAAKRFSIKSQQPLLNPDEDLESYWWQENQNNIPCFVNGEGNLYILNSCILPQKIGKNDYFLPRKLIVRHENISGSHKTILGARSELYMYQEISWMHVLQGNWVKFNESRKVNILSSSLIDCSVYKLLLMY